MSSFKNKYGQVFTPEYLIQIMFNLLPTEITTDFCRRWLDPGAGEGQFTSFVYKELMQNLGASFPSTREREKHIMKNMLTMIEINPYNIQKINDFRVSSQGWLTACHLKSTNLRKNDKN